jgi:hypothetical protein
MRFSVAIFLMFTILTFTMVVSAAKVDRRGLQSGGKKGKGGKGGKGGKQAAGKPSGGAKKANGKGDAGLGDLGSIVSGLTGSLDTVKKLGKIAPVPGLN